MIRRLQGYLLFAAGVVAPRGRIHPVFIDGCPKYRDLG